MEFKQFTLDNGLRLIIHQDTSTPIVAFNILYDVGARDENEDLTGFAHLFEHLMFGGSKNIPQFDTPLQAVGGQNNAFTSNDMTNYYITLPKQNIDTAFWLESDRMLDLAFTPKSLEVQRSVVIEEFKQRYLNQPYGDVWLLLRPLAYKKHPYKWATIGKDIKHIEDARMEDVKAFFKRHYNPENAILVIAGDVNVDEMLTKTNHWFGDIKNEDKYIRNLPQEPQQTEARFLEVERDVPQSAIYKTWHICDKKDPDFYAYDLATDILSRGNSSRLYQTLVKEKELFTEINAYHMGSTDNGLFVISGKVKNTVDLKEADDAIVNCIEELKNERIPANELIKVKNKVESTDAFSHISVLNKAMKLAFAALLGDINLVNTENELYAKVTADDIQRVVQKSLIPTNCSTLYYKAKNN